MQKDIGCLLIKIFSVIVRLLGQLKSLCEGSNISTVWLMMGSRERRSFIVLCVYQLCYKTFVILLSLCDKWQLSLKFIIFTLTFVTASYSITANKVICVTFNKMKPQQLHFNSISWKNKNWITIGITDFCWQHLRTLTKYWRRSLFAQFFC